jgi:acetylglutamate kinase
LPLTSSVSITRPTDLANELFTHRGSGTLVRRGERVLVCDSWDELDLVRLRKLIDSSFGRRLVDDYFARTRLKRAYVSENYRAAVILLDDGGYTYLDKFAVLDDAQGEGLGRAVWQLMREEHPRLFWRSRHNNVINHFYYAESDGCYKEPQWKVFWYGLRDLDEIGECIERCRARPATLIDSADASRTEPELDEPATSSNPLPQARLGERAG